MTEAINAHKKMAMGMTEGNVMKKGGKVNMKKGSMSKKPGIMIAIAIPKKGSSRGR